MRTIHRIAVVVALIGGSSLGFMGPAAGDVDSSAIGSLKVTEGAEPTRHCVANASPSGGPVSVEGDSLPTSTVRCFPTRREAMSSATGNLAYLSLRDATVWNMMRGRLPLFPRQPLATYTLGVVSEDKNQEGDSLVLYSNYSCSGITLNYNLTGTSWNDKISSTSYFVQAGCAHSLHYQNVFSGTLRDCLYTGCTISIGSVMNDKTSTIRFQRGAP